MKPIDARGHASRARQARDARGRLRCLAGAVVLATGALLAGCASLPKDVPRPVSHALAHPDATPLGQLSVQERPRDAGSAASGFALLASPNKAFAARLELTEQATRTLDLQYYAIHSDPTVARLLQAVRAAAGRGVHVRILLDDFNSTGRDALVMRMASVPGVEMRMFNPLPGDRAAGLLRALGSIGHFDRIQHRMHNKLFIADNAWAIIGSRNLGDAYFGAADGSDYVDMDMLATGPVVRAMSASFDRYWNSPLAYPVASLITPAELRRVRRLTTPPDDTAPAGGRTHLPAPDLPAALDLGAQTLVWAPAGLLVDSPLKLVPGNDGKRRDDVVIEGLVSLLRSARHSALIVSPYFVPGRQMMALFAALKARGVPVQVLTNSLASTDSLLAQVGYAHHRKQLLRLGVELHEMRASGRSRIRDKLRGSSAPAPRASLHAKLVIVDRRLLAIGSMNLDLRSKLQNTEVGLIIDSPKLAREAARQVEQVIAHDAWSVELAPDGTLHWRAPPGATFHGADHEPDTSVWLRLLALLLAPITPDNML